MQSPIRILILCDSRGDGEVLGNEFRRGGYEVSVAWAGDEATLKQALEADSFDLVVCEDNFIGLDIVAAHGLIAESGQDAAFLVISEAMQAETQRVISQVRDGVDGFIEWGRPERLVPVVERGLHTVERRRRARRATETISHRANYDSLTDLPNRTLMLDRLGQAMKAARRTGNRVLLMYMDLDHFKPVNDKYGHAAGDRLLTEAARRITSCLRDSDTASRIGGDEFAIILAGAVEPLTAKPIAEKILAALAEPFNLGTRWVSVTASIGISVFPDDGDDYLTLLQGADEAMYAAKEHGRNGFRFISAAGRAAGQPASPDIMPVRNLPAGLPLPVKLGMALAAAVVAAVIASTVLTSWVPDDSMKIAIDRDSEILRGFDTSSGPKE